MDMRQKQTYQQLSERAIECIEKDSLPQAEELLLQALKLEPKNAKNALLFSNLGLVQRRLGEFDKALESYSFALNFAPLAVPAVRYSSADRVPINDYNLFSQPDNRGGAHKYKHASTKLPCSAYPHQAPGNNRYKHGLFFPFPYKWRHGRVK